MVQRKRETPGKAPKNKAIKLRTEEEEETAQESTQNEGQAAMQTSIEVERNQYADQNGAEKAEVEQKIAGAAEADVINRENISTEPKNPEKMVSAKKNRKKNAAKLVVGAESAGTLAAETVDVDKLVAERKSYLIVAVESKNEEIVADKPRSEEYGKGKQKTEEIVNSKQIIVQSDQKCGQKEKFEMKSPQKVKNKHKVLEGAKADDSTTEKVEPQHNKLGNVESEQKDLQMMQKTTGKVEGDASMNNVDKLGYLSTTENEAQQENEMRKKQLNKLCKLQGLEYRVEAEAKKRSAAMAEKNHWKKVEGDTISEKVEVEAKSSDKAGPERKSIEGVGSEVVKQVEAEHKHEEAVEGEVVTPPETQKISTENVEAQENKRISKKQMKQLARLEAKKSKEKEAEKKSCVTAVAEDQKLEKNPEPKDSEKARPEKKILEIAGFGSEMKKLEGVKVEVVKQVEAERESTAIGVVYQDHGLTKRQRKGLRQLEQLNTLEKAEAEDDNGLSGQQNWMLKKLEHNKKAEEGIEVTVKIETKVSEKAETKQKLSEKMEMDGTIEEKLGNEQSEGKCKKSKKRKRANEEKGVKKITQEEVGKNITVEEGQTKKITEEEGEVNKITQGGGQVKRMKVDGTVEKKSEIDQSKSKKRNGANIEKEGQMKKTREEEITTEEDLKKSDATEITTEEDLKKSDATEVIEMLVNSLTNDELKEVLKSSSQKATDLLADINRVASRYRSKRTLFVKNLNSTTYSEILRQAFLQYGKIEEAKVVVDKESGKHFGFGFVEFSTKSSALYALRDPIKEINGRQCYCSLKQARSASGRSYTSVHGPGGFVNPTTLG